MYATKFIGIGIAAACLVSGLALAQGGRAAHAGRGEGRVERRIERRVQRGVELRAERRAERREFAKSLRFSDEQRRLALAQAKAVEEVAKSARAEAQRIRTDARDAQRTGRNDELRQATRAQLRELRQRTFAQVEPQARAILAGLTPEQRARLEARAKANGRTFDEARALRFIARVLASPRAVARLEKRAHD